MEKFNKRIVSSKSPKREGEIIIFLDWNKEALAIIWYWVY